MKTLMYKTKLARHIIGQPDYKAKRLMACNSDIIHYSHLMHSATTGVEKKFCSDMVDIYRKRYDWYLNH